MKTRNYERLSWNDLTAEEKTRFKVRYTILKLVEITTVVAIGFGLYKIFA